MVTMIDTYWELIIKHSLPEVELYKLHDYLKIIGIEDTDIVENLANSSLSVFYSDATKAQAISELIAKENCFELELNVVELIASEWKNKWREGLERIKLTDRFDVVADFNNAHSQMSNDDIYIDAELVFGIGDHPTTRSVAHLIEKYLLVGNSFIDIGTGTGILAILAAKCGADKIWALDIDESAVAQAKFNFEKNNCSAELVECSDFTKFESMAEFDFVAANVLTRDLVLMKDKIISYVKGNGYLAVSGISSKNFDWFKKNFISVNLTVVEEKEDNGWHAVLYKKIGDKNELS